MKIRDTHSIKWILCLAPFISPLAIANEADERLLPEQYKLYFNENVGIVNHPFNGATEKVLPTVNAFKGVPGCYIACYSHDAKKSIYPVGGDIYVMGQVRVAGQYSGRVCQPQGFENKDISAAKEFKEICKKNLSDVCGQSNCWAGGDTGGWFGIQQ
jgi:hypothetical protein